MGNIIALFIKRDDTPQLQYEAEVFEPNSNIEPEPHSLTELIQETELMPQPEPEPEPEPEPMPEPEPLPSPMYKENIDKYVFFTKDNDNKKALLVGINYKLDNNKNDDLNGCENDMNYYQW